MRNPRQGKGVKAKYGPLARASSVALPTRYTVPVAQLGVWALGSLWTLHSGSRAQVQYRVLRSRNYHVSSWSIVASPKPVHLTVTIYQISSSKYNCRHVEGRAIMCVASRKALHAVDAQRVRRRRLCSNARSYLGVGIVSGLS